jgi:C-terminal processing protease CtpA/Prc
MRAHGVVRAATVLALFAPFWSAAAQIDRDRPESENDAGVVLGIAVRVSGGERDTLGVLIESVEPGGPADRAGLREGERIAEVNGLSLRVSPEDVGRSESEAVVQRRLERSLRDLEPGDAVTLRVFSGSRGRTVTIQTSRPSARRESRQDNEVSSLGGVLESLRETQARLGRLAASEGSSAFADTLGAVERELAEMQHRLREAEMLERRRPPRRDERREATGGTLPGLRVTTITGELASYFGDRSEGGLLVLDADASWSPLRIGDVILRVEGSRASVESVREAIDSRRSTEVEVLRRDRIVTVTLDARR